jgi:hypothetical protein
VPHIILRGHADLPAVHARFQPARCDANGWVIKVQQCFLSATGRTLLLEGVAARSGFVQTFYILAEQKDDRVTLRIDPHTNVEKNEGVKRSLLLVRDLLLAITPGLELENTNLPPELLASGSAA